MSAIYNLSLKKSYIIYIIPAFFALVSISILDPPQNLDDLLRFYRYYMYFEDMSVAQFIDFNKYLTDYLLPLYIFICAKVGLPVNILIGIITYFTVFIILKVSFLVLGEKSNHIFSALFITSAISVSGLLSGVRNLHSIALVYLAIYLFVNNKKVKSFFIYFFSLITHFSSLFYVIVPTFLNVNLKKIHISWWVSFIGFFLPFIVLQQFNNNYYNYNDSIPIITKIKHYILAKDYYFTLNYKDLKIIIATIYKLSWYIFLLGFLYLQIRNKADGPWVRVLFILSILMNMVFLYLTIFERISFLAKIIFVICLLQDTTINLKTKNIIFIYFLLLFLFQMALFIEGLYNFIEI